MNLRKFRIINPWLLIRGIGNDFLIQKNIELFYCSRINHVSG
jgi:hypothetical protein